MRAFVVTAAVLAVVAASPPARAQDDAAAASVYAYPASFFTPFKADNAREMIGRVPDFTFNGGVAGAPIEARAGNVLVNGKRPTAEDRTLADALRAIPAASVIRIELIRQGARGYETGGWPLVANVVTRREVFHGSVNAAATLEPSERAGGAGGLSLQRRQQGVTTDFSLNASRNPNGGARVRRERTSAATGAVQSRSFQTSGGTSDRLEARFGWDGAAGGGRLRLSGSTAFSVSDDNNETLNELTGATSRSFSGSGSRSRNASVRYTRDLGKATELDLRISSVGNRYRFNSFQGARTFTSRGETDGTQGSIVLSHDRTEQLTVRAGVNGDYDSQGGRSRTFQDGVPVGALSTATDAQRLRVVGLSGFNLALTPKVTVDAALRYDVQTLATADPRARETYDFIRPRLEMVFEPSRRTQAILSLERSVEPVSMDSFIATVIRRQDIDEDEIIAGNANLVPQTVWTLRARLQRRFENDGLAAVSLTHTEYSDLSGRVLLTSIGPAPGRPGQTVSILFEAAGNIGWARSEDLNLSLDLPLDRYGMRGGFLRLSTTWRDSKLIDAFAADPHRFSGETPFSWSANLSAPLLDGRIRTGIDASNGSDSVGYGRSDVTLSTRDPFVSSYIEYRPTPEVTARFEVRDLSNRASASVRDIYSCPSGCRSGRTDGLLTTREARLSQEGPTYNMSLRRTF